MNILLEALIGAVAGSLVMLLIVGLTMFTDSLDFSRFIKKKKSNSKLVKDDSNTDDTFDF